VEEAQAAVLVAEELEVEAKVLDLVLGAWVSVAWAAAAWVLGLL
jgi:hypothetical protein